MKFNDFYTSAPMRYWQPKKENKIELDILENPNKYKDYIGSYKRDGEWTRMLVDENRNVTFQSRSISKVTGQYGDKTDLLPHLTKYIAEDSINFPNNSVFLGELCFFDDLSKISTDVGSILRCKAPKAIERQKNGTPLTFYIFDCVCYNGEDISGLGFCNRIEKVKNLKIDFPFIKQAEYKNIYTIVEEYDNYLKDGGEGFVLVDKNADYVPGSRTAWKTIKLKKFTSEKELKVVGTVDPKREYTGKELDGWQYYDNGEPVTKKYYNGWKAGVAVDYNGVVVKVTSGVSDTDAEWLASDVAAEKIKNGELYAIVSAMEETNDGSLRHPYLIGLREDM